MSISIKVAFSSSLKLDRVGLLLNLNNEITKNQKENYFNLIDRRKKNEPIAYIIGFKEFWKNNFKINKSVLIPRPDTEIIIEEALNVFLTKNQKKF